MYVGYGRGGMALINPVTHKQTGDVKLPDDHSIAVIDLKNFILTDTWNVSKYRANFPMTLDTANNLVFVGYRHPALFVCYDSNSGKQVSANELVGDVDDIFYYADKQRIIASGGDGYINIFERDTNNTFKLVSNISLKQFSFMRPQISAGAAKLVWRFTF